MKKNMKLLFDFREIRKQLFTLTQKYDIYNKNDLEHVVDVLLIEFEKEDFIVMEKTISLKINDNNRDISFILTGLSILFTVFLAYIAVMFEPSVIIEKVGLAIIIFITVIVIIIGITKILDFIVNNNKKLNDIHTLVRLAIFYKENK